MDQNAVVNEQIDSGKRLIEALEVSGFEVRTAFWAKPIEEGRWFLYLASPFVDEHGSRASYRRIHNQIRKTPDLWIDPFEVKVIGVNDSMAQAAIAATTPKSSTGPFAVPNRMPYPGITRFGNSTFGGVDVDGVAIYPPTLPAGTV